MANTGTYGAQGSAPQPYYVDEKSGSTQVGFQALNGIPLNIESIFHATTLISKSVTAVVSGNTVIAHGITNSAGEGIPPVFAGLPVSSGAVNQYQAADGTNIYLNSTVLNDSVTIELFY